MGKLKLIDYLTINPDPAFHNLDSRDKVKIMDSLFNNDTSRGLDITYDLSHSGRRINNRIYTVKGQMEGIDSLVYPYPKPILAHHDADSDPIGRFVGGQWDDLSNEALNFFGDVKEFMEVKKAFDADDPERIYASMKKYNLLTNKSWPGLGRMRVQAKITDEKAIEKFLDGRYITFSAGSTTDRHVCSICLSDWAQGDMCEHRHGKIYDGDVCVFVTGKFEVLEGSVVNMPADDLSQVLSMELTDKEIQMAIDNKCNIDRDTLYLSDSVYNITEKIMSEHVTERAEVAIDEHVSESTPIDDTVVELEVSELADSNEVQADSESSVDADASVVETSAEQSTDLNDGESAETAKAETSDDITVQSSDEANASIEKLDGLIGKLGSMINKANEANEVLEVEEDVQNNDNAEIQENLNVETLTEEKEEDKEVNETVDGSEEERVQESEVELDIVDGDFDWYLLEAGLSLELGDAKLSSAQREKLKASDFCGPDRSFPVPDCAHVTAARRLIGRAKLSSDQKAKVLACVNRKAEKFDCDNKDEYAELQSAYSALKEDHIVLLRKLEELEDKLSSTLEVVAKHFNTEVSDSDLDALLTDSAVVETVEEVKDLRDTRIENPSVASAAGPSTRKKLGKYEQSIVDRYEKLLTTRGSDAAERYAVSQRRYLPRGFHPNKYIGE